jgi:hypothetical protein
VLDSESNIRIDRDSVLLIKVNGEYIRVMQSTQRFKRLGKAVTLEIREKQAIERLAVRVLDVRVADFD